MVELLSFFFRGCIDDLPPDKGLFEGPLPVLLRGSSTDELVLLLLGHQRGGAKVSFGRAHGTGRRTTGQQKGGRGGRGKGAVGW